MDGASHATSTRERGREIVRALIFVAALAAIVAGPGRLGGTSTRAPLRGWAMYSDLGVGLVDARWVVVHGERQEIVEAAAILPGGAEGAASRRLVGRGPFLGLGRQLCRALGPSAEVRAHARIATAEGWEILERGDRNHCAGGGPTRGGPRP